MSLFIQIISLMFSFVFGMSLFFIFKLKLFKNLKNTFIYYFLRFVLILFISLLYFAGLYFINGGIVHLYFLLFIIFGFLLVYNFF